MPAQTGAMAGTQSSTPRKATGAAPEKKYKCQFCNRAFSRSEHRSRHERSRKSFEFSFDDRMLLHETRRSGACRAVLAGLLLTDYLQQIPRRGHSSVRNARVPSCDATFSCDTTEQSMQKMAVCRYKAIRSDAHPRSRRTTSAPSSLPLRWTRRRWSKSRPAAMTWLIWKRRQC